MRDGTASVIATATVRSLNPRLRLTLVREGTTDGDESCRLPGVRLIIAVECLPYSSYGDAMSSAVVRIYRTLFTAIGALK